MTAAPLPTVTRDQAEAGRYFDTRPEFVRTLLSSRDRRVLVDGPFGTGKTRCNLEKLRACCLKYPRMRGILLRSVRKWLTNSALVTWEEKVLEPGLLVPDKIHRSNRSEYRFKNGSVVVVAGLDDPQGVLSAEYDVAVIIEAIEIDQDTAEKVSGRLRYSRMPYQQLLMDCNPGAPSHWLHHAFESGWCRRMPMRHADNPAMVRADGTLTEMGRQYLADLDQLTGVRRDRFRDGLWRQAEGAIYEAWDPRVHLVDSFPVPANWDRYWAIDFGFTNPLCWQFWAIDPDGRAVMYREIYQTQELVKDVALRVKALAAGEPRPRAVLTDHDKDGIADVERYTGETCTPADKVDRKGGIQQVQERIKYSDDRRPRLVMFRDALCHEPDRRIPKGRPLSTAAEVESYVWNPKMARGEEPLKENDHGCDAMRYFVRHLDGRPSVTGAAYGTDYDAQYLPDLPPDTFR